MKLPITAIVSTKNEELAITDCLTHLEPFGQVIVVDSGSQDRTGQLTREAGVQLVNFEWNGLYPKKKQWCLDNVDSKFSWVIFVDADERPSRQLLHELSGLRLDEQRIEAAFDIGLLFHFQGKQLKHGHRVVKRALLDRRRTSFPILDDLAAPGMGELEGHYQPIADGPVGRLKSLLIHDDPGPLSDWIARHNKYSDWEAHLASNRHLKTSVRLHRSAGGQLFDLTPAKPLFFFLYCYIVRLGFLDGKAGRDYAISLAWYYWVIEAKVRASK